MSFLVINYGLGLAFGGVLVGVELDKVTFGPLLKCHYPFNDRIALLWMSCMTPLTALPNAMIDLATVYRHGQPMDIRIWEIIHWQGLQGHNCLIWKWTTFKYRYCLLTWLLNFSLQVLCWKSSISVELMTHHHYNNSFSNLLSAYN